MVAPFSTRRNSTEPSVSFYRKVVEGDLKNAALSRRPIEVLQTMPGSGAAFRSDLSCRRSSDIQSPWIAQVLGRTVAKYSIQ